MSIRAFLEKMEDQDEVVHINDKISPRFEISSIMETFPGGPVLSFENVEGYSTKVVGNVCATRSRICSALEVPLEGLYGRLLDALRSPVPPEIVDDAPK